MMIKNKAESLAKALLKDRSPARRSWWLSQLTDLCKYWAARVKIPTNKEEKEEEEEESE
jgi:hypothetical protein